MAEFRPGLCTEAAQQGLMQWLLKRIKVIRFSVFTLLAVVIELNEAINLFRNAVEHRFIYYMRQAAARGYKLQVFYVGYLAKMPFDANKLYCSEILAILLQNNDTEEQEMMENLFDALCSCLMLSSNRDRFLKGEGLQLMNLMLR
ncbi:hypothetical protein GOODEAATRI_011964 [Goodea atripinnis]|uniref:Beta-catenin-like protein 1 N-terminal domain-containing protein n=1 Tax=Goodea atripinnis TaxID=208336 RepID=A0ABV0NJH7_9TELE